MVSRADVVQAAVALTLERGGAPSTAEVARAVGLTKQGVLHHFPSRAALDEAVRRHGTPGRIRVDQGCQFTSRELDLWAYARGVVLDFSRPGKPTDNAHAEAFNARFRAECLNQHWFLTLDDARQKKEEWRIDYNVVRPHRAIGNKPPISLMNAPGASGPP